MKKAKLALTITMLFAFIGGSLAFKISTRGNIATLYTSTSLNGVPICLAKYYPDATTGIAGVVTSSVANATTKFGDPCDKTIILRRSL